MLLPVSGEITTPVDDPCQFDPAWRSVLAEFLLDSGICSDSELLCISARGAIPFAESGVVGESGSPLDDRPKHSKAKNAKKGRAKKPRSSGDEAREEPVKYRGIWPFSEFPQYRCLASDPWVMAYIRDMVREQNGLAATQEGCAYRLARRWYMQADVESAMKKRLEPMLLTSVGTDIIAWDLIGEKKASPAIEAYEKMYFNCRDENFRLSTSMQLLQRMATPWGPLKMFMRRGEEVDNDGFVRGDGRPLAKNSDVWKAIALSMGYDALMFVWSWDSFAHGMTSSSIDHLMNLSWKCSAKSMLMNIFTGSIAHEDLSRILAAYTSQAKQIADSGRNGGEGSEIASAFLAVMQAAAPKMRMMVEGGEGMITTNEIRQHLAAQEAINKQHIKDAGKQVAVEVIDAQISKAVSGE